MPNNLQQAVPVGVMPKMVYTSFEETRVFPMLTQGYNDATVERSLVTDGVNAPRSIRNYKLASRLVATDAATFKAFYEAHGQSVPFYWYNPFENVPGTPIGSNWDSTGATIEGRYIVRFTSNWQESTGLTFTEVQFELVTVL